MKLSVIVPTLNEERSLPQALASIPGGAEVIVADGRSIDRTREVAARLHALVVVGEPGRGAQLNLGAKHAGGEVLLFFHADCVLDRGADAAIEQALSDPRVVGGSFQLRIRPTSIGLTLGPGEEAQEARPVETSPRERDDNTTSLGKPGAAPHDAP
jgi:glycosyltransferase involved in cell wall biosynthesis